MFSPNRRKYVFSLVFVLAGFSICAFTQSSSDANLAHFGYDRSASLDVQTVSVQQRADIRIEEITYASPKGGRVPAFLVLPRAGKDKKAAVLWGHWMMPNSPTANRTEFLEEAIALAPSRVVSLMIDTPYVRPGFKADSTPLSSQDPEVFGQQVIDLRRGIDLLLARDDVDPKRLAYVGHSFDASCGAALDAADKRIAAFVFMANPLAVRDYVLMSPKLADFRNSVPKDKLIEYLNSYAWADPATYATQFGPAPALFQYATHDEFVAVDAAKHFFEISAGPKQMKFYDADHALNAEARRDRVAFLQGHLGFNPVSAEALDKVPQTK